MSTRTLTPASAKQISFIAKLAADKLWENPTHWASSSIEAVVAGHPTNLDVRAASTVIDYMLACRPRPADPATLACEGYYVRGDVVFVVVANRTKTATYAKRLVIADGRASWRYAPGAGRNLAAEGLAPLTVEEAARLGHLHGVCVVCARRLTDPASVERGIGPVCAKRLAKQNAEPTTADTSGSSHKVAPADESDCCEHGVCLCCDTCPVCDDAF